MKKFMNISALSRWYRANISLIVMFLIVLVFFTVTSTYIPYLNVLLTPEVGFGIVFFSWYLIFGPSTNTLITMGGGFLTVAAVLAVLQLSSFDDIIGILLYALLTAILFNYGKEIAKQKDN